jgi:hypothetical protein
VSSFGEQVWADSDERHHFTRIAFGFRSPDALVALAMLDLGGMCPPLPGRAIT